MKLRRIRDTALAVGIGFGATVAAFGASQLRSTDITDLGELKINDYCPARYGASSVAVLLAWNAYGWHCTTGQRINIYRRVDFDEACQRQYGDLDDVEAFTGDESWPFGWHCVHT